MPNDSRTASTYGGDGRIGDDRGGQQSSSPPAVPSSSTDGGAAVSCGVDGASPTRRKQRKLPQVTDGGQRKPKAVVAGGGLGASTLSNGAKSCSVTSDGGGPMARSRRRKKGGGDGDESATASPKARRRARKGAHAHAKGTVWASLEEDGDAVLGDEPASDGDGDPFRPMSSANNTHTYTCNYSSNGVYGHHGSALAGAVEDLLLNSSSNRPCSATAKVILGRVGSSSGSRVGGGAGAHSDGGGVGTAQDVAFAVLLEDEELELHATLLARRRAEEAVLLEEQHSTSEAYRKTASSYRAVRGLPPSSASSTPPPPSDSAAEGCDAAGIDGTNDQQVQERGDVEAELLGIGAVVGHLALHEATKGGTAVGGSRQRRLISTPAVGGGPHQHGSPSSTPLDYTGDGDTSSRGGWESGRGSAPAHQFNSTLPPSAYAHSKQQHIHAPMPAPMSAALSAHGGSGGRGDARDSSSVAVPSSTGTSLLEGSFPPHARGGLGAHADGGPHGGAAIVDTCDFFGGGGQSSPSSRSSSSGTVVSSRRSSSRGGLAGRRIREASTFQVPTPPPTPPPAQGGVSRRASNASCL